MSSKAVGPNIILQKMDLLRVINLRLNKANYIVNTILFLFNHLDFLPYLL